MRERIGLEHELSQLALERETSDEQARCKERFETFRNGLAQPVREALDNAKWSDAVSLAIINNRIHDQYNLANMIYLEQYGPKRGYCKIKKGDHVSIKNYNDILHSLVIPQIKGMPGRELPQEFIVTVDVLNVRASPSLQSNIIGSLRKGQLVSRLESSKDGQWYKVRKDSLIGWSFHKYLTAKPTQQPNQPEHLPQEPNTTTSTVPTNDTTGSDIGQIIDPFAPQGGVPGLRLWNDDQHNSLSTDNQFSTRESLSPILSFNSPEQNLAGTSIPQRHIEMPALEYFSSVEHNLSGTSVQRMIDHWALNGLIQGGAFIDTGRDMENKGLDERDNPISDWTIITPFNIPNTQNPDGPLRAYPNFSVPRAHWYFIAPDPYGPNQGWTPATLKAALLSGEAVALSIGQIIMLAGDEFSSFDELMGRGPTGSSRRKAVNLMHGFDNKDAWAYVLLSLKAYPGFDWKRDELAALNLLRRTSNQNSAVRKEILSRSSKRFTDTENLVTFLREARGPTVFSEAHVLARILSSRKPFSRHSIALQAPWLGSMTRRRTEVEKGSMNDDAFNIVLTNGHYLELALHNESHFHPLNWQRFEYYQQEAFTAIQSHIANPRGPSHVFPIPAEAIALTAFGLHYLTDAFSSGHMRVPRKELGETGALGAKIMHDLDGRYGLLVKNQFFGTWRAYGDGYLLPFPHRTPINNDQRRIIERMSSDPRVAAAGINLDFRRNYEAMIAAVGSAFKQLHYEAQRVGLSNPSSQFKRALEQNRGSDPKRLQWDDLAKGDAFNSSATLAEKINANMINKLIHMSAHRPEPLPSGNRPSDLTHNHPPLYIAQGGTAIIPKGAPYYWFDRKRSFNLDRRLRLKWHGLEVNIDFSDYFHLEKELAGHPPAWMTAVPSYAIRLTRELRED